MQPTSFALSRRGALRAAVAAAVAPSFSSVFASESEPCHLLVGFSAGGGADAVARLMAASMAKVSNREMVVENRAGAGGRIAIMAVKGAAPDGNTLFFGSTSVLTLFPHVFTGLPYEMERDFTPVSTCCGFPFAIVVSPKIGVHDLKGLAAWAKAHPDKAFFGTPGVGTPQHLIGSLFGKLSGAPLTHMAFKSGAEATQQLLAGTLPVVLATAGQFYPMHRAGRVRMIATTGKQRQPSMQDVPTAAESGYPELVFLDSFGFIAPAKLPARTAASLEETVAKALDTPAVKQGLARQDMPPLLVQGADYVDYLRKETAQWAATVKAVGFSPMGA